ncbi:CLUMA_CG020247, isoform A [Clunio marinus]|uniref:CLUMA_CG020247, isoform A n=1 Tax=Clunio marinus TaxID=568069 RepID=A0A1J1J673_9DIPT|nr:CLUMA_CG020247, isoform A [Clunio marinus]
MEANVAKEKLEEISLEFIQVIKAKSIISFNGAIDELYQLEKKYRATGDAISIGRILVAIVQLYFYSLRLVELNESIIAFALKKHLQSEQAIGEMIRECCKFIDLMSDEEQKVKLLDTLKLVTNGKLYSEFERAKVCKELAAIHKRNGNIEKAISILEDLKIDTLTSLEKTERIEIILQLMELLIESKEFVKCLIIAKKINKSHLNQTKEVEAQKLKFYELMIVIDQNSNYSNTSSHYQKMLNTDFITSQIDKRKQTLIFSIVYCVLAPFDREKSDMMHRLMNHKYIDEVPLYKEFLKEFTTIELINWYSIKSKFKEDLMTLGIFNLNNEDGLKKWKDFRTATIEHNVKVFASYYQRAYLSNMSEFLDINIDETEKHLCNLIINKSINAKIDRLSGIVTFHQKIFNLSDPHKTKNLCEQEDFLHDWLCQLSSIMNIIDNTTHLINKEMEL